MNRKTNTITPTIVEGVIAVANHKLRVEGLESYKQFLAKTFYFKEDMWDALKEGEDYERKRIFENLSHAVCYGINGHVTEEELDRVEKYLKQFSNSQSNSEKANKEIQERVQKELNMEKLKRHLDLDPLEYSQEDLDYVIKLSYQLGKEYAKLGISEQKEKEVVKNEN